MATEPTTDAATEARRSAFTTVTAPSNWARVRDAEVETPDMFSPVTEILAVWDRAGSPDQIRVAYAPSEPTPYGIEWVTDGGVHHGHGSDTAVAAAAVAEAMMYMANHHHTAVAHARQEARGE